MDLGLYLSAPLLEFLKILAIWKWKKIKAIEVQVDAFKGTIWHLSKFCSQVPFCAFHAGQYVHLFSLNSKFLSALSLVCFFFISEILAPSFFRNALESKMQCEEGKDLAKLSISQWQSL